MKRRKDEAEFQAFVLDVCRLYGWLAYHTHDSRKSIEGFFDIVACNGVRTIYVELKREDGKRTAAQTHFAQVFARAGNEVYLWRPSDKDEAVYVLTVGPVE